MTDLLFDVGGVGFRVQAVVQQELSMASLGLVVLQSPAVPSLRTLPLPPSFLTGGQARRTDLHRHKQVVMSNCSESQLRG